MEMSAKPHPPPPREGSVCSFVSFGKGILRSLQFKRGVRGRSQPVVTPIVFRSDPTARRESSPCHPHSKVKETSALQRKSLNTIITGCACHWRIHFTSYISLIVCTIYFFFFSLYSYNRLFFLELISSYPANLISIVCCTMQ